MVKNSTLIRRPAGLEDYGPLALHEHARGAGRWDPFIYSGPPGSLRYVVYTPAGYTLEPQVPMVVTLRGCTQTPAESTTGTRWNPLADQQAFIVVYPEQTFEDNPLSCWDWFLPEHQVRGIWREAGVIDLITRQVMADDTRWNVDPARVHVAGMSAGGAMAILLGATYPDLYAAVAVHSGLEYQVEYQAATDASAARPAMTDGGPDPVRQGQAAIDAMNRHGRPVPSIVFHGTADGVVNGNQPTRLEQCIPAGLHTSAKVDNRQVPDGRGYTCACREPCHGL